MPAFYAHTKCDPDENPLPEDQSEPSFTEDCPTLNGKHCADCEALEPKHGHFNKVAFLAGKFASEMFVPGSADAENRSRMGPSGRLVARSRKVRAFQQQYFQSRG